MRKNNSPLLIILAMMFASSSYADSTARAVNGDLVRTFDGSTHGGWFGTITLDDWGFVGPEGRTAEDFLPHNGFGNGLLSPVTFDDCIADPASCGIGQMQHVVTTGPDGITQDVPHDILGDFLSPNGPYPQTNVDSMTTFYLWGYTTVAGSTFNNMLIDFDGDYHVPQNDMTFQFYSPIEYQQIVPEGGTRVGSVADGLYYNKLAFQPYALSDAEGWCGSVVAAHPNAHEAMAGQVRFDVAMDVYFKNADGSFQYWSTEITRGFQMRSFGDIAIDLTSSTDGGKQVMSARAIVNNTDPSVPNQSVGPLTPVGDIDTWHNKVSFMGASVIPGMAGEGDCGILSDDWVAGLRGPNIKKFSSLLPKTVADATACTAAGGSWQTAAFAGYSYILRADGMRVPDYAAPSYGPDPMTTNADADSVLDYKDNCTDISNESQQDTDGDKFGNACDGDFNNDDATNSVDIGLFKQMFFAQGDSEADHNSDGVVNSLDIGLFKARFFQAPGPSEPATY